MADFVYDAGDLEVLARSVLFGPRGARLNVLNVFRAANDEDPVDYVVNANFPSELQLDDAVSNLVEGASGADEGEVVLDSEELETVFTAALVSPRSLRLRLVNLFREANGEDPVEYLVNADQPDAQAILNALESVSEAEEE